MFYNNHIGIIILQPIHLYVAINFINFNVFTNLYVKFHIHFIVFNASNSKLSITGYYEDTVFIELFFYIILFALLKGQHFIYRCPVALS